MARKCKAILKSGTRKGSRCAQKPKFSGYCGRHKHLLLEEAKSNSSLQHTTLLSSLGANLILIAEKTSAHWPEIVELMRVTGESFGLGYPTPGRREFDQQLRERHLRNICTTKALNDARELVSSGKTTYSDLVKFAQVIAVASNDRNDVLEAEKIIDLAIEIESQR